MTVKDNTTIKHHKLNNTSGVYIPSTIDIDILTWSNTTIDQGAGMFLTP